MDQQKVGKFLKSLRSEKQITQTELAEILGVSNRSISRWENRVTMPDFDLVIELAKYYDVEIGEILEGNRKEKSDEIKINNEDSVKENKDMDKETEKVMLQIADYNNLEKEFFSKKMTIMFSAATIGIIAVMTINTLGLTRVQPFASILPPILGFVSGTLLTGLVYSSRYIIKLKAARMRLKKAFHKVK